MKYFIISDIHSFYKELIESLKMSGFDINNENHTLVVLGDVFDRGNETKKVYKFLRSVPKKRLILIKGNHEDLFLELLEKEVPSDYDFSNGTVKTFCEIAGISEKELEYRYVFNEYIKKNGLPTYETFPDIDEKIYENWQNIKEKVKKSNITKWIKNKCWKDYYEIGDFILTHSFIPVTSKVFDSLISTYGKDEKQYKKNFEYNPYWRKKATKKEWYEARWGNPLLQYKAGLFNEEIKKGKTLVLGHWRCSDFHKGYKTNHNIYFSKNLIAIDATTKLSGKVNVLVIDENFICYNQYREGYEL